MFRNITLFCASGNHIDPTFFAEARSLGEWLGSTGRTLVYGGANVGLMEATAQATRRHGGTVVGIITDRLCEAGRASNLPHRIIRTESLAERKRILIETGDLFIALPGGIGTMDEVFEVLAGRLLGYHDKPLLFCNTGGFYSALLDQMERFYEGNFTKESCRDFYLVKENMQDCLKQIEAWEKEGR